MRKKNMLTTEDDVKNMLGVTDWRKVTKDQIIKFASKMNVMDPEIAKTCIQQMPAFKEQSTTIVTYFYELCNTELNNNSSVAIEQYKELIKDLQKQLSKRKINETERQFIIEQMIYIADRIDSIEHRKEQHKRGIIYAAGVVGTFAIAAAAAILGVNIELPFSKEQ